MGTSLTGVKIKDSYDSLLKVTDNGPLDGSLQVITDGLGNNSALSLSTAGASVGGTLAVSGAATLSSTLGVSGAATLSSTLAVTGNLTVDTNTLFVDAANDRVGVGNFAPAVKLDVVGQVRASTGILFGSDTSSANALDDYEEGTFTPTLAFGGASTGITYSSQIGVYTKIGKVVTVRWGFLLSSKGSATGLAKVTGLPFTIESLPYGDATAACSYAALSASVTTAIVAVGGNGSTDIYLRRFELGTQTGLNDGNFNNNSYIYGTFVYTVA